MFHFPCRNCKEELALLWLLLDEDPDADKVDDLCDDGCGAAAMYMEIHPDEYNQLEDSWLNPQP